MRIFQTQILDRGGQAVACGSVCRRYLAVVPRPSPAAQFLVHPRYLVVGPRLLPATALAVRCT
jgi:hypothetical protein